MAQPGPMINGSSQTIPYYPPSNFPYPTPSPGTIPNTGGTIPKPTTGPFGSTTSSSSAPENNSLPRERPIDRLPPDSDEYPEPPPPVKSTDNKPPDLSNSSGEDAADIKADRSGESATPKSKSQEYIKELEEEGEMPGNAAIKDSNLRKSGLTDAEDEEFKPPSAFLPETAERTKDDEIDDPAVFLHQDNWYRGIAKFDDEEQQWYLQYEALADPETGEGIIYLADYTKLSSLRNRTIVIVEGSFDNKQLDRFGKPIFVIRNLKTVELDEPK
jgi:hypothetical protein